MQVGPILRFSSKKNKNKKFFLAVLFPYLKVHSRNFGEKRDPFEISFSQRKRKSKRREKKNRRVVLKFQCKEVGNPEILPYQKFASLIQPCWHDWPEDDKAKSLSCPSRPLESIDTRPWPLHIFMSNCPIRQNRNLTKQMKMTSG